MTDTPILVLPELASAQAIPEAIVNENTRWLEFFAAGARVLDRDEDTPPGSPADGDAYLVATGASGVWSGHDDEIALRISTAWAFKEAVAGMVLYVDDEDIGIIYDGAAWSEVGGAGAALEIEEEGVSVDAATLKINFTGASVTATQTAPGEIEVAIADGASAFTDLTDVPASYTGQAGKVAVVKGTEDGLEFTAASSVTAAADSTLDSTFFGDGSDGNVTISSGTTVLTRDMYYNNLTIDGTGSIDPRGFRIFVRGTLDISAAPARAIYIGVSSGSRNGGNASTLAGGSSGGNSIASDPSLGNASLTSGGAGANGGTGAGTQAANPGTPSFTMGQQAGSGGAGGAVGGTGGGASRASNAPSQAKDIRRLNVDLAVFSGTNFSKIGSGACAPGGSSGAGDGVGSGGGGGGGAAGGGIVFLAARTINRSGSTAAGAISAVGGNGGNGASGSGGTNRGGGGGGGGGSGGWIYLIYRALTGSTATACLDASGGNGGAAGNGVGTGGGGAGGEAGGTGRIDIYNLGTGAQTITAMSGPLAGNAASGGTGGAAKTATAQVANL